MARSNKIEIKKFQLEPNDKFLFVATDGVWEFLSNAEVLRIIKPFRELNDIEGACDKLMAESLKRWEIEEEGGIDDITFVLAFL